MAVKNGKRSFILQPTMRMNKAAAILLLMLSAMATSARAQVYYKSGTFKVEKAEKLVVYPGVMGSPITTTVNFKLVMKTCTRLTLDSFWMDGYSDKVNISYANGSTWDGKPMKGDTLNVSFVYYILTQQEGYPRDDLGLQGSNKAEAPVAHKGKALFRYTFGGKNYYYSIKDIENRESIYAP